MGELIAIREAARRLGVSDTAVRKAIKAGRVTVAAENDRNGRPLLEWPACMTQWGQNTDASKRTHSGSQGSPRRVGDEAGAMPVMPKGGTPVVVDREGNVVIHDGMTLTEAKTAQAIYTARQARLDYEQSVGRMIEADQVKARAFKMARSARDALLTMPDRLAPILASSTDVLEVHRLLLEDIERTCQRLAQEAQQAA